MLADSQIQVSSDRTLQLKEHLASFSHNMLRLGFRHAADMSGSADVLLLEVCSSERSFSESGRP